jgi:hypothetical protein
VARALYSARLLEGEPYLLHPLISEPVPSGFVWDIRDISMYHSGTPQVALGGFQVFATLPGPHYPSIFSASPALGGIQYHWVGRCILNVDEYFTVQVADAGPWDCIVTGYVLTTP